MKSNELLELTRKLSAANPNQAFWVELGADDYPMCAGATNPDTGEIIPILAATITGHVLPYHGCAVDGKPIEHTWISLTV